MSPTLEDEIVSLKEGMQELKTQFHDLAKKVQGVEDLAKLVKNVEESVTKVGATADLIYGKLAGSLSEKGLIFKQSDSDDKIKELEQKVKILWEDRLKVIAGAGAAGFIVTLLYNLIKG